VRRLVQRVRELREAKQALARAALDVAALGSPYVVDLRQGAPGDGPLVLKHHKPP
jgi:hypothetical protein